MFGLACYTPITKVCVCVGDGGCLSGFLCVWALSRRYLLNHKKLCNQTWYGNLSSCIGVSCENFVCYLQGQGHSEGLHHQNMNVSTVSSELMIFLHRNLV